MPILSADHIDGFPVLAKALLAARDLEMQVGRLGFGPTVFDSALWVTNGIQITSLLIWRPYPAENCAWIVLAWTHPGFRKLGLYRELVAELRIVAKAKGFHKIGCGIDPKNHVSLAAHRSLGGESCCWVQMDGAHVSVRACTCREESP